MFAAIKAIEYHLPATTLTNEQLSAAFPDWTPEAILAKTGISQRHLAGPEECATDLAYAAARKLFASGACLPADIDFLLFCTETPDCLMPASACLLQERLGLSTRVGALDFNLGCSGFVYGLSLAKGLIETGQARNVLLLTADTLSKFLHPRDRGARALLGDAGAATLIQAMPNPAAATKPWIGPFIFGTDGAGFNHLCIRTGGTRRWATTEPNTVSPEHFFMNGPEVFTFTLRAVPPAIHDVLARSETTLDATDLFVFHQANGFMLEALRQKVGIPAHKFVLAMRDCGNTAASTIPIALAEAQSRGQLQSGMSIMLVAFGTGYSWCAAMMRAA